ncbi:hypothetical protein C8R32_101345 [Nitrosospira sp. Nsp5]|uniref:Terminase small subunit protein n=1 Tax=Nitrosospira multiformis TaxID=1231 RepID=A0ABY0TFB8_9PROT|nr:MULTISPECIES: hypothetical protein [Nitrosospira]PTR10815.1 hypothetical protein C8R32_101345 [Nitrosospira sp. Nsp5]SDQ74339.1 hypothetical protein SAMN05216402_2110 [Nitrosospira multiformis]
MNEHRLRKKAKEPINAAPNGKRGAPTIKTRELVDAICTGISLGKSARAMCVETGISQRVLWNWLASDAALMQQYLRAKELCVDAYAEEIIEISDDGSKDTYTDEKGKEVMNREVIARSQLRIDARKWYAARLAPKKYGDKLLNTREDGDTGKPIVHKVEVAFVAMLAAGK